MFFVFMINFSTSDLGFLFMYLIGEKKSGKIFVRDKFCRREI